VYMPRVNPLYFEATWTLTPWNMNMIENMDMEHGWIWMAEIPQLQPSSITISIHVPYPLYSIPGGSTYSFKI